MIVKDFTPTGLLSEAMDQTFYIRVYVTCK